MHVILTHIGCHLLGTKASVDQQACVFRPSSATTKSESLKLNLCVSVQTSIAQYGQIFRYL